jgi:hypothetical protein
MGVIPIGAHLRTDGAGIERPPHRLSDRGAVDRTFEAGQAATEQFVPERLFLGLQPAQLGFDRAETVDEIAGR